MEENNQQPTNKEIMSSVQDVLEVVQTYAGAMDKNFDDFKKEIKEEVSGLKAEMQQGFSSIHAELDKINNELTDIKSKLDQAITTETEDTGAISSNYLDLLERVNTMEQKIKQLELQKQST